MRDENGPTEQNPDMLQRIVAKLLALAVLAERVSSRSYPLRCLVLWLLRPAEVAAREFATQFTPAFADHATLRHGNSPADALRLAAQFREMARVLDRLARKILRFTAAQQRRVASAETRHWQPGGTFGLDTGDQADSGWGELTFFRKERFRHLMVGQSAMCGLPDSPISLPPGHSGHFPHRPPGMSSGYH